MAAAIVQDSEVLQGFMNIYNLYIYGAL